MAEETGTSGVTPVTDRRPVPRGVVPRGFQTWLMVGLAAGIVLIAAAFVVVHKHFFENTWYVSVEFCAFALLIGVLYYWTESFILVIVIHALRDIEIAYLEYLVKVEELGDEAQAAHAIEQAYRPQRPEKT